MKHTAQAAAEAHGRTNVRGFGAIEHQHSCSSANGLKLRLKALPDAHHAPTARCKLNPWHAALDQQHSCAQAEPAQAACDQVRSGGSDGAAPKRLLRYFT